MPDKTKTQEPQVVEIQVDHAQAILDYLTRQPYDQVWQLVEAMKNLKIKK